MTNAIALVNPRVAPESWESFNGFSLRRKTMTVPGENPLLFIPGTDVKSPIEIAEQAREEAVLWMHPARKEDLIMRIGEMYVGCKRKAEHELEKDALIRLYVRELSVYPGDVVLDAMSPGEWTWFPSIGELLDKITSDGRFIERTRVLRAIENFLNHVAPEPIGPRPSPEYVAKKYAEFKKEEPNHDDGRD